jgi:hypothetical protein
MPPLDIDTDRLSDQELVELATDLWKRLAARGHSIPSLVIRGTGRRPIGYLIPASGAPTIPDAAFLVEAKRRLDNPPDHYLSVDEFLDALDDYWSKADAAGRQLDSAASV